MFYAQWRFIYPSDEWKVQPNLSPSVKTVEKILKILSNTPSITVQETNVIFGGRLAEYKYYDMAPIIEKVLRFEV